MKYRARSKEKKKVIRSHTCPVVYLQNFSKISSKYYEKLKNFNVKTYREPNRNEFTINVHDKLSNSKIFNTSLGCIVKIHWSQDISSPVFITKRPT